MGCTERECVYVCALCVWAQLCVYTHGRMDAYMHERRAGLREHTEP